VTPELAQKWKELDHHRGKAFIADGIIDEESWARAPRKVLFLLKEAYDTRLNSDGFDLRTLVKNRRDKIAGPTWWRMGCWAYLLHNVDATHTPCFPPSRSTMRLAVLSSAVVNVKKSDGKKRSDMKEIAQYAEKDRDLLRQQISEIGPDIIVAGGSWAAVPIIWDVRKKISNRFHSTSAGPLINFWHPAAQIHNDLLYYSLAGILQAAESKAAGAIPPRRKHVASMTDTVSQLDPA